MSVSEAGFLVFFSASLEGMLTLFTERNCAPDHRVISARFPAGNKKPPAAKLSGVLGIRSLTMTYSHMGNATLPSAQVCFTSEFGMGSGGSRPLWSSGKTVDHWGTRWN
ncbi:hypothetical protein MARHY0558 [Marinobacter nauticus ATCC 49840]|nr:hypothetical protein MARHY0558 [Marinobacter nauticus ATCC 49840]